MHYDPHEDGQRLLSYAKRASDEAYLQALNENLLGADLPSMSSQDASGLPIIYIVGAPRSGTTLLSQLVSRYLPIGYINNLIARFWLRPSVGIRLSHILMGESARQEIRFNSVHGVTAELAGPHEFGYFWRYWFKLDDAGTHHLSAAELADVDSAGLKSALENEILASLGMPVVFKNVICGFQAPLLGEIHKNSLFIHIDRDLCSTCASILKSRHERYGSYSTWWSLKPSTFSSLPVDPVEQVITQVIDCRRELNGQISKSGVAFLNIQYEELCGNPNGVLQMICDQVTGMGYPMSPITSAPTFQSSGCARLPNEMMRKLEAIVVKE